MSQTVRMFDLTEPPTGELVTMTADPQPPTEQADTVEHDRPDVEVVAPPPAQLPDVSPALTRAAEALERATDAALSMPELRGRDEFLMLAMTARILSMSAGAPKAVRDNPHLAFHLALIGRDLGISPSAALQQIDVIGEGEDAQLSLSPELLNGQIRRLGLGRIVPGNRTDTSCEAVALAPDGEVLGSYEFTWDEARQAGLVAPGCKPFEHSTECLNGGQGTRGKRCRQGYRTYPKRMLWWRASGYAAADYFPEASIGLYSPEELGAVVDENGRPIDPGSVELPDGFEIAPPPPDPRDDVVADATLETDPDLVRERDDLTARIEAIKATGADPVAALRTLWEETDDDGRRKTPPWLHPAFTRRHLVRARAVVKSIEDRIKRSEWGDDAKDAWADQTVTGAGFGTGNGAKVTGEDFEHGTGKTPHQLARERAAREKAATELPAGDEDAPTAPVSDAAEVVTEATGDGQEAQGDDDTPAPDPSAADAPAAVDPDDETRAACIGCDKEIKTTVDGRNHPGPNGRAGSPHRSYHRRCAPFD